jgi:hypothetical protein
MPTICMVTRPSELAAVGWALGTRPGGGPGGAIEVVGDQLTGSQIAAAFGSHAGLPARYEAMPLSVLDGNPEDQAMFRWFAKRSDYPADLHLVAGTGFEPATSGL